MILNKLVIGLIQTCLFFLLLKYSLLCLTIQPKGTSEFNLWILPVVSDSEVTLVILYEVHWLHSFQKCGKMIMNCRQVRIPNLGDGSPGLCEGTTPHLLQKLTKIMETSCKIAVAQLRFQLDTSRMQV